MVGQSSKVIRAPVVPVAILNQILSVLPEIQAFSQELLRDVKARIENWSVESVRTWSISCNVCLNFLGRATRVWPIFA